MLQNILSNPALLLTAAFALFAAISNLLVVVGKVTNSPKLESFARKAGGFIVVAEKVAEDVVAAPTKVAAAAVFIQDVEKAIESGDVEGINGAFLRLKISLVNLAPGLMTKLDAVKGTAALVLVVITSLCLSGTTACSASQTAATATAIQDVSDAVCQELEANLQTDPAWLQFVCTAVDKQGNKHQFKVKMATATAKKLGTPAPAASSDAKAAP